MEQPLPQEDFKWFGEGFDGFPKTLPDDTIEYVFYIIDESKPTKTEVHSRLRQVRSSVTALINKLAKDYIWQREEFALDIALEEDSWVLKGRTNFGDSVADEWLIVYLVREITKQHSDVVARVFDTMGEFLLIEAAEVLPGWLNPEVAENRVWIQGGQLKIIPLEQSRTGKSKAASRTLTIHNALAFLQDDASKLIYSPLIEEEAFYRTRNYPQAISNNLHHSLIQVPRSLAFLLHEAPKHISPAIEAFYLRDAISLRLLQKKTPTSLRFKPADLVTASVRFPKVGYAQLKSQEFTPPPAWEDVTPPESDSKGYRQVEMGMKVACGFEMLLADPQNQDKRSVREIDLLLEDLAEGEEELPSDEEIRKWSQSEDDEAWLDINFEDFEKELAGRGGKPRAKPTPGFGDKEVQENLRKMVERFEAFMNDDSAGTEGAEMLEEMDYDDDEDDDEEEGDLDSASEGEDRHVSFDDEQFTTMMREMMGLPPQQRTSQARETQVAKVEEVDSEEEDDSEEIRKLSEMMKAELNESGALNLDPTPRKIAATTAKLIKGQRLRDDFPNNQDRNSDEENEDEEDDEQEGDVDIDYNLAKNLLESLKSQGGMAGPAGNLMGLMGINFPRDADDEKT
ncbi:putative regulatory factor Sgt1 [Aulographum hederae CBS 113979]|uniref:Putative regulatory factor Sgt1 n=1 Tax=Aulographum hederae CBS 113979 TaxID=1176131 RepID=A0A6G1GMS4_9PEZI|nr:putative regulatory factor Sgt1 [Aulographum hederae CBS 113979]